MTGSQYQIKNEKQRIPFVSWLGFLCAVALVLLISIIPLNLEQQLLFAGITFLIALLIRPSQSNKKWRTISLVFISCIATGRYIFWRLTETLGFGSDTDLTWLDQFFSFGLLLAEVYAWSGLFLGYFQTLWPLKRPVMPLPADQSQWPSVDVYIPTYNEPLKVVAPSILAAKNLDWPKEKLNIYLLDDGCREEFRQFAERIGIHYIERWESTHAKAGNINHAMTQTDGDYIAIFDCDHVPVQTFLTDTMGWFVKDDKLGLVQTPHLFFSPDPVEKNLNLFRRIPNEGQLFYGLIQDGNDTSNATFFCGSCAVLNRKALDEIGGIAPETVTEDAHTSLKMHRLGWNSAYINKPLAGGLATEKLIDHVNQRVRWARGMTQIFRIDNPLFGRGLKWTQRLSYFNAMSHFLFSIPRIVFLTAPLAFLFFEAHMIQAAAGMMAVFALPHIIQSLVANSAIQQRYRHAFWSEVYETILAAHIFWPTVTALFNPLQGKFNVTNKGGVIDGDHFEWRIARPYVFILLLNIAALLIGIGRLLWWNVDESGTVMINLAWTLYNIIILGAATAVAREKKQSRKNVRIERFERAVLTLSDGTQVNGKSLNLSTTDITLEIAQRHHLQAGESAQLQLIHDNQAYNFTTRAVSVRQQQVGLAFESLTNEQMKVLVQFTHGRADAWQHWYENYKPNRPLFSFFEIVGHSFSGLKQTLFGWHQKEQEDHPRPVLNNWLVIASLVALVSLFTPTGTQAAVTEQNSNTHQWQIGNTADAIPRPLYTNYGAQSLNFSVRMDELVTRASLNVRYAITPLYTSDLQQIQVLLNNAPIGSIPISANDNGDIKEQRISIDPILVGEFNRVTFRLVGKDASLCLGNAGDAPAARIYPQTALHVITNNLPLVNDLSLFPVPFFDYRDNNRLVLPFVMDETVAQSSTTLKASGILAAWFGLKADYRGSDFPVQYNKLAPGNNIVFVTPDSALPEIPASVLGSINGASIAMIDNPIDSRGKLLLVKGRTPQELYQASQAIAFEQIKLSGEQTPVLDFFPVPARIAYDAPRWVATDRVVHFDELYQDSRLENFGFSPDINRLNFRIPPDLFRWQRAGIPLSLQYQYSNIPLSKDSALNLSVNQSPFEQIPLAEVERRNSFWRNLRDSLLGKEVTAELKPEFIQQQQNLHIPFTNVGGVNQLQLHFDIKPNNLAERCNEQTASNMITKIDKTSSLDLRGFKHFTRLPDLAMFANTGFPFTRLADLSESAFVLPNAYSANDVRMLLNLLAKFSASTGFPANRFTLASTADAAQHADKDLIVIGHPSTQPLFKQWASDTPVFFDEIEQRWHVTSLNLLDRFLTWWDHLQSDEDLGQANQQLASLGNQFSGLFGMQSPLNEQRSLIAVISEQGANYHGVTEALNNPDKIRSIQGDLFIASAQGNSAHNLRPKYYTGDIDNWTSLRWYLSTHFIAFMLLTLFSVVLGTICLRALLHHKAAKRLALMDKE